MALACNGRWHWTEATPNARSVLRDGPIRGLLKPQKRCWTGPRANSQGANWSTQWQSVRCRTSRRAALLRLRRTAPRSSAAPASTPRGGGVRPTRGDDSRRAAQSMLRLVHVARTIVVGHRRRSTPWRSPRASRGAAGRRAAGRRGPRRNYAAAGAPRLVRASDARRTCSLRALSDDAPARALQRDPRRRRARASLRATRRWCAGPLPNCSVAHRRRSRRGPSGGPRRASRRSAT